MEGEELSHGRETWTMKSKLYHGLDSYRAALTLSIRDKQGAFLTVAPAEGKKKGPSGIGGEGIFKRSWSTTGRAYQRATSQN